MHPCPLDLVLFPWFYLHRCGRPSLIPSMQTHGRGVCGPEASVLLVAGSFLSSPIVVLI